MAADDVRERARRVAHRSPGVRLHRRDHRPVQGLRDQQQLLRHPRPSDRDHVGARSRRRGVDAAAAVPLQRGVGRARRHVAHRWAGSDLPEVLGVELLARDQPHRRHAREHARQHGHAHRQRPGAPRSTRFGHARGEHDAAVHVGRADATGRHREVRRALRDPPVRRRVRHHRGRRCGRGCRPGWRTSRTRPAS